MNRTRSLTSAVVILLAASAVTAPAPAPVAAAAQEGRSQQSPPSEAEQIARRVLKAGSDLFDAKNAQALAATYTDDGIIHIISKHEYGSYKDDTKRGRAEIEQFYRELFQDPGPIDSENTVEFARLIAPDLLVVHGRFRPNTGQKELPFVQMRIKQGPAWQLKELWLFLSPGSE
jgi:hypothetical protein